MPSGKCLVLSGVALVLVLWLATIHVLAQDAIGGEGAIAAPTAAPTETIDPESLMPSLYFLLTLVAVVAVAATILLALGMGRARDRELSEGERRLGRMLGEMKSEFQEGREQEQPPS